MKQELLNTIQKMYVARAMFTDSEIFRIKMASVCLTRSIATPIKAVSSLYLASMAVRQAMFQASKQMSLVLRLTPPCSNQCVFFIRNQVHHLDQQPGERKMEEENGLMARILVHSGTIISINLVVTTTAEVRRVSSRGLEEAQRKVELWMKI